MERAKKILLNLLIMFILAGIPCLHLIFQENDPKRMYDIDKFADLYEKDGNTPEDTSVLFLDVIENLIPVQSEEDSTFHLIVNRSKLLDFITIANQFSNYKSILLDVTFDESIVQPDEEEKLAQLLEDIYYSSSAKVYIVEDNDVIIPDFFNENLCVGDSFAQNRYGMFVASQLMDSKGNNSAALEMYNSIQKKSDKVEPSNPLFTKIYFYKHHIFRNNPIVRIFKPDSDFMIKNMSIDSLLQQSQDSIRRAINNKVIFIGDIKGKIDKHCSYAGKLGGPYLIYCEYKAIENGHFYISNYIFGLIFLANVLIIVIIFIRTIWISIRVKFPFRTTNSFKNVKNHLRGIFLKTKRLVGKLSFLRINELIKRKANVIFSASVDVLLKFYFVNIILDTLTEYLYYNYDFLYSNRFSIYWFLFIEVIVVFCHDIRIEKLRN